MVWLVPAKAEHLTLGEKRIAGCSGRKLAEVVLAIMLQRKSLDLDLPAALGKHVTDSCRQLELFLTKARHWVFVPFQHPQRLVLFINNRHGYPLLRVI
ncbi:hypothetical protein SAMN04244574_04014 [Azotobacter beijerinckii]|uniref:Uncharacterized protein n=1 Tax=Azotobacter beijerinckii TaxID=170623 RepID=A0A1I4GYB5_9GAMM|nr:hypothetical protein SAMN04244571_04544 [Azotobacter beijerinckii]SFL34131.1 hypothetical protein SAMN04244574_04014 [Azotobacter beijerinckii]